MNARMGIWNKWRYRNESMHQQVSQPLRGSIGVNSSVSQEVLFVRYQINQIVHDLVEAFCGDEYITQ